MKAYFMARKSSLVILVQYFLSLFLLLYPGWASGVGHPTGQMAIPRVGHSLTLIDGQRVFLAGGGYSELGSVPGLEIFNLLTLQIEKSATGIEARSGHTATVLKNEKIALVGGSADFEISLDTVEIVDPKTLKLIQTIRLNRPRSGHRAFVDNQGRLVIVGGFDGREYLDSVEVLEPGSTSFLLLENVLKEKRGSFESTLVGDKFVITGGYTADETGLDALLANAEALDVSGLKSDGIIPLSSPRAYHTAVNFEGELYILGGISDYKQQISSTEKVDLKLKKSFEVGNLSIARSLHSISIANEGFAVNGGTSYGEALGDTEVCNLEPKATSPRMKQHSRQVVCTRFPDTLEMPRWSQESVALENGETFVLGGISLIPDQGSRHGGPTRSVEKLNLSRK
jgi:hypothetical protein